MSQNRNMKWLNNRRVIYRHDGDDIPTIETKQYKYYENGTYACYHLFNTKAKITTYKSLKWHMLVLYYLNQEGIDGDEVSFEDDMRYIFKFIANKDNGFVTFFISNKALEDMIGDVLMTGGDPPKNKKRKVIFKPYNMLTLSEKLSIVGKLIGRSSICKETIYQAMIDISEHRKITVRWLAEVLGVSQRTVYRHMCDDLKRAKQEMNEEI
jgi:DNA-binding transcriptional ArsR family regulator